MTRQKHSAYLSPTNKFKGSNICRDDRLHYNRVKESSEQLRRAIVRYQHKRDGVQFHAGV